MSSLRRCGFHGLDPLPDLARPWSLAGLASSMFTAIWWPFPLEKWWVWYILISRVSCTNPGVYVWIHAHAYTLTFGLSSKFGAKKCQTSLSWIFNRSSFEFPPQFANSSRFTLASTTSWMTSVSSLSITTVQRSCTGHPGCFLLILYNHAL